MTGDLHQSKPNRDTDEDVYEPPQLRRFRQLVSLLMVVMMVGILGIAVALIFRLSQPPETASGPVIEGEITLPDNMNILSVSRSGTSLYLVLENTGTGERYVEERRAGDQTLTARFRLVPE